MECIVPRREDIHYEYNTRGYMMYYKGEPIGGAGIDKSAKGSRGNLKLFKDAAEATKRSLLAGGGSSLMKSEIVNIERRKQDGKNDDCPERR